MPKRTDLKSILVLGAGPIMIGQACEFDYAGTQGCLALKEEGYRVILINSNPATIMTDPEVADVTYIEPLTVEFVKAVIEKERPDALLPTLGGQTALNLAVELEKQGVPTLGVSVEAIYRAEDREVFRQTMLAIGLDVPKSVRIKNKQEALSAEIEFPVIARPSFALGGSGAQMVHNREELSHICEDELTLEEALIGWKEFEIEVMRDAKGNCIAVCAFENIDPLGIHTGDSVSVSPVLTLTDKEYQKMRSSAFAAVCAIGMETGGANVQFAVHPKTGRMVIIEMNPRVSRSSALASKATGFPIAKIAAKLAVGYTFDELPDIVLEPAFDYVAVKIPCFQFEKFPNTKDRLGLQMQSVGEVFALGHTFSEALLKAMRSIEMKNLGSLDLSPNSKRLWHLFSAFRQGMSIEQVQSITHIDPWFLHQIKELVEAEKGAVFSKVGIEKLKWLGFSDAQIALALAKEEKEIYAARKKWGITPVFKHVDSCSAQLIPQFSYAYATYEAFCEAKITSLPKILIIGSGSNRIGQGIEFDYCCVHAVQSLKKMGYETILVNCNPETISTDYDCADKLYCTPLTTEDLLPIIELEKPLGVLLSFGGQTPLNLAKELEENNVPILGLNTAQIDLCEDRKAFCALLQSLQLKQPKNQGIDSLNALPQDLQYPVIIRPSFVLGGRAVAVAQNPQELHAHLEAAFHEAPQHPVLIEEYLKDAIEVEIDAISDGKEVFVPEIMEQVEMAGIHSGDSASYLPPLRISADLKEELIRQTEKIAQKLSIQGLLNIQFAIQGQTIYVLEVNPRASRSIPFLSKAVGIDLIDLATRCIMGMPLEKQEMQSSGYFYVKEAVLPYNQFGEIALGPEMKSTGEVMGIGKTYSQAYAKAQLAAGYSDKRFPSPHIRSLQSLKTLLCYKD